MSNDVDEQRKNMLEKLNTAVPASVPIVMDKAKENYESDYEYTRKKLKNLADRGEEAIEHFAEVAKETGEPRAFEVLATLLKNTSDIVKGVIENASAKAVIDSKNAPPLMGDKKSEVHNTTIFVGSAKELLDKVNSEQKVIDVEATPIE